jgi:hypothetical protein
MRFPVIFEKESWPDYKRRGKRKFSQCICGKKHIFEPHTFVTLDGGALAIKGDSSTKLPKGVKLKGFLDMSFHGGHGCQHRGCDEKPDNRHAITFIALEATDGQYEMYFCSTRCLRKFLNAAVDDLERKIGKAKRPG